MEEEVYDNNYKKCELDLINHAGEDNQQCLKNNEHNDKSKNRDVNDHIPTVENKNLNILEMSLGTKNMTTEIHNNSNLNTIIHERKDPFRARQERVGNSTNIYQTSSNNTEMVHRNSTTVDKTNSSNMEKDSNNCINPSGSLLINRMKDYDIQIDPDVIDIYTLTRQGTKPESVESPECKKNRIKAISAQCRLHPSNKKYNQGPVINPPLISPGVMVGYSPAGQRHEVDLNAHRPKWFDSEYSRMQFDYATKINVSRMMHQLSMGEFLPNTLDPDVERKYLKEKELVQEEAIRHFENKDMSKENFVHEEALINVTNKIKFLETEQRLTEIAEFATQRINDFPAELGKKIQDVLNAELSPLMFLKNPIIVEVVEKLSKQSFYKDVAYSALALFNKIKLLFDVPNSQTFFQYFNSEAKRLEEETKDMTLFDVAIMTEEPNNAIVATHSTEGPGEYPSGGPNENTSESTSEVQEKRVIDEIEVDSEEEEWVAVESNDHWEDINRSNSDLGYTPEE